MSSPAVEAKRVKELLREWDAFTEPLTTPIVYHPGGWEDTVPEELKREVIRQRIEKMVNGGWDEATDAEVLCYLMTASLVQPLSSDWTQIFLYQSAQFMPQIRDAIPDTPKELNEYQKSELRDLKRRIRASQLKRRKNKKKEGNMAKRKVVMEEHEGTVLMGVMQEGCDPVTRTYQGSLEGALGAVPQLLTEAQEKWATSPKNPAYKPPVEPKPAAAPAQKVGELPLLSKEEKPAEAEAKPAEAEEAKPAEEEKEPEAAGAAEEQAPEPAVPAEPSEEVEPEAGKEEEAQVEATEPAPEPEVMEALLPAPVTQPAAAPTGQMEYWLKDGRGPYADVQTAMDAMGLDKETRPHHNRWDRLSTQLKEQIQRRPKA